MTEIHELHSSLYSCAVMLYGEPVQCAIAGCDVELEEYHIFVHCIHLSVVLSLS